MLAEKWNVMAVLDRQCEESSEVNQGPGYLTQAMVFDVLTDSPNSDPSM